MRLTAVVCIALQGGHIVMGSIVGAEPAPELGGGAIKGAHLPWMDGAPAAAGTRAGDDDLAAACRHAIEAWLASNPSDRARMDMAVPLLLP